MSSRFQPFLTAEIAYELYESIKVIEEMHHERSSDLRWISNFYQIDSEQFSQKYKELVDNFTDAGFHIAAV